MLRNFTFRLVVERPFFRKTPIAQRPLSMAGRTDIGRVRSRNEDSFRIVAEAGVAVVADGMGGHPGGDVASRLAAETAAEELVRAVSRRPSGADADGSLEDVMSSAVRSAHDAIRSAGREKPDLDGMGTTLTALAVQVDGAGFVIGHVGDSRAYRLRDGELQQLTRDHTWVQERFLDGQLTLEQARRHPFSHLLTQCLGLGTPPRPQLLVGEAMPGDVFLLCSDGLVGMLSDEEVVRLLTAPGSTPIADRADDALDDLLAAANAAGGLDNITGVIVAVT